MYVLRSTLLLIACGVLACSNATAPPVSGTSPDNAFCGNVGLSCCPEDPRCRQAGSDCQLGTCCALAGGATCNSRSDCCDDEHQCDPVERQCCAPIGRRCSSSAECCDPLTCDPNSGTCQATFSTCGRPGGPCDCPNDTCQLGLTCEGGVRCVACGQENQLCCGENNECASGLRCNNGRCSNCGGRDEPCCGTFQCDVGLQCDQDFVCRERDTRCTGLGTCRSCNGLPGCSWCNRFADCRTEQGSCPSADWITEAAFCPSLIGCNHDTCGTCVDEGCSWCASEGRCASGLAIFCQNDAWVTNRSRCP